MGDDLSKIRLLVCHNCKTIEELPDFQGNPRDDHVLAYLIERRHTTPEGTAHIGNLFDIDEHQWRRPEVRLEVLKEIKQMSGKGLGDEFYEVKSTFQEDAAQCWKSKKLTRNNCDEYRSERKALVPNTKDIRKELGLGKPPKLRYLCDFCPYTSKVMQRKRAAAGYYDYVD